MAALTRFVDVAFKKIVVAEPVIELLPGVNTLYDSLFFLAKICRTLQSPITSSHLGRHFATYVDNSGLFRNLTAVLSVVAITAGVHSKSRNAQLKIFVAYLAIKTLAVLHERYAQVNFRSVLRAVLRNYNNYTTLSVEDQRNIHVISALLSSGQIEAFALLPNELKTQFGVIKFILKYMDESRIPDFYTSLPEEAKNNEEIAGFMLEKNSDVFARFTETMRARPTLVKNLILSYPNRRTIPLSTMIPFFGISSYKIRELLLLVIEKTDSKDQLSMAYDYIASDSFLNSAWNRKNQYNPENQIEYSPVDPSLLTTTALIPSSSITESSLAVIPQPQFRWGPLSPLPTSQDFTQFVVALNATSVSMFTLFSTTRDPEHKNFIFFTPNLIASLSMLYAGAPRELRETMEQDLNMGSLKGHLWHELYQWWSNDFQRRSRGVGADSEVPNGSLLQYQTSTAATSSSSSSAASPFVYQQMQVLTHHQSTRLVDEAKDELLHYNPHLFSFTSLSNGCEQINGQVEQTTQGQITNLIDPESLDPNTVLLMASAALFKGSWKYPFKTARNSQEEFTNSDGTRVKFQMMNLGSDDLRIAYDNTQGVSILELPFHGDLAFWVIKTELSDGAKASQRVSAYVASDSVQELLDNRDARFKKSRGLAIGIPKVSFSDKTDLFKELQSLPSVQQIRATDFNQSLINAGGRVNTPQFVSQVNFTLNEEGAEVAAASYSPSGRQSCDPRFKVQSPFGFVIVDQVSRTILGMGKVVKLEGPAVSSTSRRW